MLLFKSSLNVIIRNKEILIFPIVTSIATVVINLPLFLRPGGALSDGTFLHVR